MENTLRENRKINHSEIVKEVIGAKYPKKNGMTLEERRARRVEIELMEYSIENFVNQVRKHLIEGNDVVVKKLGTFSVVESPPMRVNDGFKNIKRELPSRERVRFTTSKQTRKMVSKGKFIEKVKVDPINASDLEVVIKDNPESAWDRMIAVAGTGWTENYRIVVNSDEEVAELKAKLEGIEQELNTLKGKKDEKSRRRKNSLEQLRKSFNKGKVKISVGK